MHIKGASSWASALPPMIRVGLSGCMIGIETFMPVSVGAPIVNYLFRYYMVLIVGC